MCTSFLYPASGGFFGRNLDLDTAFGEQVVITPRGYHFPMKNGSEFRTKQALIGMASVQGTYPLYAEAVNESGVAMAGLNFPGQAIYNDASGELENVTPFELIPRVLGDVRSLKEAKELLRSIRLLAVPFSDGMPLAPLHFMICDRTGAIVAEPVEGGLKLYEDPYLVMTNNPPFPFHDWNMKSYRRLDAKSGEQSFGAESSPRGGESSWNGVQFLLPPYAAGMGSIGLPGDLSSASRFVRAAFHLANSVCGTDGSAPVTEVFHILDAVSMTNGSVRTDTGGLDITRYSCCIDMKTGTYYYKTYWNSRITAVPFTGAARTADLLTIISLRTSQDVFTETI